MDGHFGQQVRAARLAQRMTQQQLAATVGTNASYLSMIERGLRTPSVPLMRKLTAALRLPAAAAMLDPGMVAELHTEEAQVVDVAAALEAFPALRDAVVRAMQRPAVIPDWIHHLYLLELEDEEREAREEDAAR